MTTDESDLTHRQQLLGTKTRRLQLLELQAAQKGHNCPPEITMEIVDLRKEIAELRAQIQADAPALRRRKREQHNGPWRCDRCGSMTLMLLSGRLTDKGLEKSYTHHPCGGEWWPA